ATKALASFALHVAPGLNCLSLMCLRVRSLAKLVLIRVDPHLSAADFFPPLVRAHLRSSVANCFPVLIRDHPRESAVNFPSLFPSRAMSGSPASPMFVQIHDILYRMYRDILYTPARAERAQEQQRKWPGKGWMSKSNVCDL